MGHITAQTQALHEQRERQRRLLRAAPDRMVDGVELDSKAAPRSYLDCELRLRAIADVQLDQELVEYLERRAAHITTVDTRIVVNRAGTGSGLSYVFDALGSTREADIEAPAPDTAKLVTFTAAATIADLLADDGYRDPRSAP